VQSLSDLSAAEQQQR